MVMLSALVRRFAARIGEDDVFNGAAVLGFYLTLAIFPAIILVMAILPYLPVSNVDSAIMDLLMQALPPQAAGMFTDVVHDVTQKPRGGLVSFGLVATLWATSTGMYAIMQQLNKIFRVKEGRGFLRGRWVAVGLSVLFVGLVVLSLSLVVLGGALQAWIADRIGGESSWLLALFALMRWIIIAAGLVLGFALTYFLGPNHTVQFSVLTVGSVAGASLLVLSSIGFARYVENFGNYSATYGSIGAVIVLMLWLYMAGLSLLLGAEFNALRLGRASIDASGG
jgi:membrane protein